MRCVENLSKGATSGAASVWDRTDLVGSLMFKWPLMILDCQGLENVKSSPLGNFMKPIIAILASTILISGAFTAAPVRSAGAASAPDASAADAKRSLAVEKHIKDMHAKLKITPAEESQWATVAQTMRDSAIELDKAIDKREGMVNSAPALDNLNAYGDIAQAHADSVKKLAAVFSPLYASMPDDQKKVADDVFAHRMHKDKK
jgi:hypothetical protein